MYNASGVSGRFLGSRTPWYSAANSLLGSACPLYTQLATNDHPQRSDKMTTIAHHAFFFWLLAFILLLLASISSPTMKSISFLNAGTGPDSIRFGTFGYTGSNITAVGYEFPAVFAGYGSALSLCFLLCIY